MLKNSHVMSVVGLLDSSFILSYLQHLMILLYAFEVFYYFPSELHERRYVFGRSLIE
jgi:hypothetical protein